MWGLERILYIQSLSNDKKTIAFDHSKRSTGRSRESNEYEQPEQISKRTRQVNKGTEQGDISKSLYHFLFASK